MKVVNIWDKLLDYHTVDQKWIIGRVNDFMMDHFDLRKYDALVEIHFISMMGDTLGATHYDRARSLVTIGMAPAGILSQVSSLIHEWVHVKQNVTGELVMEPRNCCLFKGKRHKHHRPGDGTDGYGHLPWEKEAFEVSIGIMLKFLHSLNDSEADIVSRDRLVGFEHYVDNPDVDPLESMLVSAYVENFDRGEHFLVQLFERAGTTGDHVAELINVWAARAGRQPLYHRNEHSLDQMLRKALGGVGVGTMDDLLRQLDKEMAKH